MDLPRYSNSQRTPRFVTNLASANHAKFRKQIISGDDFSVFAILMVADPCGEEAEGET